MKAEIEDIRDLEILWDLPYTSSLKIGYVVDLFEGHHLFDEFKARYWPYGNTPAGQASARFYLRLKQRYEDFLKTDSEAALEEVAEDGGREFAAEDDLRDFLAKNPGCIEPGLRLYEADGRKGIEFRIDDGRIDILALDKNGKPVVIELKVGRGRNKTLGQLLYYMGWVDKHLGHGPCRGIIIAKEITDDLVVAVHRVPGVSLLRYSLSVSVEPIHTSA